MSGFPFDHLSLAEIAECERLAARRVGKRGGSDEHVRLAALLARRCRPLYPAEPQDAA